jgi:uncharacterized protein (DUF433 family)
MDNVLMQHIESTPDVLGGSHRIAGHRVRVLDIVVWHEKRGYSPDQIVDLFPGISLADVHAALVYYFDHPADIEAEFQRESKSIAELKPRYPSQLQNKLGE